MALALDTHMDINRCPQTPAQWATLLDSIRCQTSDTQLLLPQLRSATQSLSLDLYCSDPLLLDIWLEYLMLLRVSRSDDGAVATAFKLLKAAKVGVAAPKLHLAWADFEASIGNVDKAKSILVAAIAAGLQPANDLRTALSKLVSSERYCNKENDYTNGGPTPNAKPSAIVYADPAPGKTPTFTTSTIQVNPQSRAPFDHHSVQSRFQPVSILQDLPPLCRRPLQEKPIQVLNIDCPDDPTPFPKMVSRLQNDTPAKLAISEKFIKPQSAFLASDVDEQSKYPETLTSRTESSTTTRKSCPVSEEPAILTYRPQITPASKQVKHLGLPGDLPLQTPTVRFVTPLQSLLPNNSRESQSSSLPSVAEQKDTFSYMPQRISDSLSRLTLKRTNLGPPARVAKNSAIIQKDGLVEDTVRNEDSLTDRQFDSIERLRSAYRQDNTINSGPNTAEKSDIVSKIAPPNDVGYVKSSVERSNIIEREPPEKSISPLYDDAACDEDIEMDLSTTMIPSEIRLATRGIHNTSEFVVPSKGTLPHSSGHELYSKGQESFITTQSEFDLSSRSTAAVNSNKKLRDLPSPGLDTNSMHRSGDVSLPILSTPPMLNQLAQSQLTSCVDSSQYSTSPIISSVSVTDHSPNTPLSNASSSTGSLDESFTNPKTYYPVAAAHIVHQVDQQLSSSLASLPTHSQSQKPLSNFSHRPPSHYTEYSVPLQSDSVTPNPFGHSRSKDNFVVNGVSYKRMELVGRGASSKVFKVLCERDTGQSVFALKKVKLRGQDPSVVDGYINEISLLKKLSRHERIIRLVDAEINMRDGTMLMVLEYGEIDLAHILKKSEDVPLSINLIRSYWEQMLQAVQAIHDQNIIHSDLKPANFLMVEGCLKLIDFGIAKTIPNDTTNIQRDHQTGTANYMAPEAIVFVENNGVRESYVKLGRSSDVWSLGCILYQFVYGSPPFGQMTLVQKLSAIVDPRHQIVYPATEDQMAPLIIQGCLQRDPKHRMTIQELMDHEFLHPDTSKISSHLVRIILERAANMGLNKDNIDLVLRDVMQTISSPKNNLRRN
ncbi:hypothetical protein BASA60_002384 [Batrachochytrium salamandrivorans]|nr:hypothetical protein BASA60_002384 [Batrachochytrium salamandrivorans]